MAKQTTRSEQRLIRLPEVLARTTLSRSTVYRGIAAGSFPKQVRIGEKSTAWLESEISLWISAQVAKRTGVIK